MPKDIAKPAGRSPNKIAGYSIASVSVLAALALIIDRYGEYATGAESLTSWALPPAFLFALAASTLAFVKLGHPSESENDA